MKTGGSEHRLFFGGGVFTKGRTTLNNSLNNSVECSIKLHSNVQGILSGDRQLDLSLIIN